MRLTKGRFSLEELARGMAAKMRADFALATKQLSHPGAKGRSGEEIVIQWLRPYLPSRFDIGSGFIVDVDDRMSHECDIVIFDRLITTPFRFSDTVHVFPVEGVCAVGAVTSRLGGTKLKDDLSKLADVKKLDRTGRGANALYWGGGHFEGPVTKTDFFDQVFCFIFAFDSLKPASLGKGLRDFNRKQEERSEWTNMICTLDKCLIAYADETGGLCVEPQKARKISVAKTADRTLLIFWQELFYFLQGAHSSEANLSLYGWKGDVPGDDLDLP